MPKIPVTITFRKSKSQFDDVWLEKIQCCSTIPLDHDRTIIEVIAPAILPPRINAFCPLWFDLNTNNWIGSFNSAVVPPTKACLFVDEVIKGHVSSNITFRFGS